jgi:multiple sugar transport system permease protein
MVWRQIYDPTLGLANYFLKLFHLAPLDWTSDSSTALLSIVLVDVWQWTPFFILTLSAGLAALPHEPVESAKIDGASTLQIIWHITLPMLKTLISIILIFRIMDTIKVYDLIYVLTEGGPGVSTETLNYYTYLTSFRWLRMGPGSALAIIMLLITLSIGRVLVKLGSKGE